MNWKNFLTDVSNTLLNSDDLLNEFKDEASSNWLGFPPVTEHGIQIHEKKLKTLLPPSYKEFLMTTNGFKQISSFIWDILPLDKIDWIKNFDNHFYQLYTKEFELDITDEEYFVYGEEQDTVNFRNEYLIKTLAVSNWGDAVILLLNPEVKFGDEWEAWMFANWYPGAARYKSFEELMQEEYSSYLDLLKNKK